MKGTPWNSIITAGLFLLLMAAVLAWRVNLRAGEPSVGIEPWEHVSKQHPIPEQFKQPSDVPAELLEALINANPFSPQRRTLPQNGPESPEGPGIPRQPALPVFVFKGRLLMGASERAILEDFQSKKTYFLQVGQEVTGFKLLDIEENQVVLLNLKTNEELVVSLSPPGSP